MARMLLPRERARAPTRIRTRRARRRAQSRSGRGPAPTRRPASRTHRPGLSRELADAPGAFAGRPAGAGTWPPASREQRPRGPRLPYPAPRDGGSAWPAATPGTRARSPGGAWPALARGSPPRPGCPDRLRALGCAPSLARRAPHGLRLRATWDPLPAHFARSCPRPCTLRAPESHPTLGHLPLHPGPLTWPSASRRHRHPGSRAGTAAAILEAGATGRGSRHGVGLKPRERGLASLGAQDRGRGLPSVGGAYREGRGPSCDSPGAAALSTVHWGACAPPSASPRWSPCTLVQPGTRSLPERSIEVQVSTESGYSDAYQPRVSVSPWGAEALEEKQSLHQRQALSAVARSVPGPTWWCQQDSACEHLPFLRRED